MTGAACTRAVALLWRLKGRASVFTQCPQCETVFRLSADALGAAGGQVRCGRCGEVFDSLKRLAEEPHMFTIGETTLELEARAEQILESLGVDTQVNPETAENAGAEIATLESAEPAEESDRSLEFSLTPTDLDRIFIEVGASGERTLAAAPEEPQAPDHGDEDLTEEGYAEDRAEDAPADTPVARWEPAALAQPDALRPRRWPLIAAIILLALLLATQIVHRNREWLAAQGRLGGALRALYAKLGNPLPVPAILSGYQLRQWGASGDAAANGALRVRASILNTTNQLQPFPLLRVTLEDRFGAHIGTREFEPAEYSGKPLTRLLGPGERADATVEIPDPGKDAEGFELDVCLRGAEGKINCAGDSAPHSP
jgi:predicted Zn finger-like uncharacterized protein